MKKHSELLIDLILLLSIVAVTVLSGRNLFSGRRGSGDGGNSYEGVAADEVHFAIQPSAAFIPLYVAKEKGWLDEAMAELGVKVYWHDYDSGPPINESLLSGEGDVGVLGDVPTVFAIALGQDNVIIATAAQAADSYAVLVPADSDITDISQLRGKGFATVIGTTAHNLMDKYLASGNMEMSDVRLVNIAAGDTADILKTHSADAVAIWEPTVTRLTDAGVARILGSGSDCGLAGTNTLVARRAFAEDNPRLVEIIKEQYKRGAQALSEGLDEDTAAKIAAYMKLDIDQIEELLPKFDYTVDITQEDIDSLNDTIAFLYEVKQIPKLFDISDSVVR